MIVREEVLSFIIRNRSFLNSKKMFTSSIYFFVSRYFPAIIYNKIQCLSLILLSWTMPKLTTILRATKKEHHKQAFWSMVENHFENNTIRCQKLATIVSGRKNVARPFVRRKQKFNQISWSAFNFCETGELLNYY